MATIAPAAPLPATPERPALTPGMSRAAFAAVLGRTEEWIDDLFAARERLGGGCEYCAYYATLEAGAP
jgi:hypothetical protein